MLLLVSWIYGEHQGAAVTSTEELDKSHQLVLWSQHMEPKENSWLLPFTQESFVSPQLNGKVYAKNT